MNIHEKKAFEDVFENDLLTPNLTQEGKFSKLVNNQNPQLLSKLIHETMGIRNSLLKDPEAVGYCV